MKRRSALKTLATAIPSFYISKSFAADALSGIDGPFKPTWESLKQYQVPDWYKNAKFGMWAHWGPQCQPERGDWYARNMYKEGGDQYKYHCEKYGHPSKFGFKDVINEWKAENWNPEELVSLYKNAGAQYFMALANHHDNLDLYNSSHQPKWNSTKVGPKKDIIGGWAKAAKNNGLPFGVSVHASHAWTWYETAQRSDKNGPLKGVPYDGKLTAAQGKGKWWNGLDPQDLYAQNHALSENSLTDGFNRQWEWGGGASKPSKAYCEKFYKRTIELIDKYSPDLVYFDDTALPLYPVDDAGLRIAAYMYNQSIKKHGTLQAVVTGKVLNEQQRKCLVWDIERGQSNAIEPQTWQTDTCIGEWHYDRRVFDEHKYKTAKMVMHTLADVVSKNGNYMLNIPLRGDGTMDSDERKVVEGITAWMKGNSGAIYDTRPFTVFGEGPASDSAAPLKAQGFNEGKGKPFTSEDIRFTTKNNDLYAISLGNPADGKITIKTLAKNSKDYPKEINRVSLLGGSEKLSFNRTEKGLEVTLPENRPATDIGYSLKIS